MSVNRIFSILVLLSVLGLNLACEKSAPQQDPQSPATSSTTPAPKKQVTLESNSGITHMDSVVWAINVGGDAFTGVDGHSYLADDASFGGQVGSISAVIKGTQDKTIYQTYRSGDIQIRKALANGTYDIMFRFAEPQDIDPGERVFDIVAENNVVVTDLDVRVARDGNPFSALDRAVTNVVVTDGQLDIDLKAKAGVPIINAIIVRKQVSDSRQWKLIWSDEFDYDGQPDSEKWTHDIWPARKVNDEDQTYTDRLKNVRVENGMLVLEAHKEAFNNAEYTSGRIHSAAKGDLLYGRIDVRAKLPPGQGTWPAIWMLPSDPFKYATTCKPGEDWQGSDSCDAWPNSGEIDIMEHVGYDMNTVHGTVHNRAYYWVNGEQRKGSVNSVNAEQEFHVYSLEWTPDSITILFDGAPYFFYMNEGEGWKAWPYDHAYNLILNLAVGGFWGRAGGPIDDSIFPVRMEVDYVRMYKQE
ncbi:MAG: family 16 glycosylhydrolase [Gammaproteobacteria bacterium]|nr:family 16 glycosylhydrolase [Gammaproteobacteria bacterium]NNC97581.1 family 16 glycosylhydrolase [Gammaproteobacteria bacterium]NNM14802.1 family 16 glycosylhydrolase [Gammaproteobacteria bacterium]